MADTTKLVELATRVSELEQQLYGLAVEALIQEVRKRFPSAKGVLVEKEGDDGESWYWVYGVTTGWDQDRAAGDILLDSRDSENAEPLNEIASFIPVSVGGASWIEIRIPEEQTDGD